MGPQRIGRDLLSAGNDIGDQTTLAAAVRGSRHECLADGSVSMQGRLDFSQFDAEAANLDLAVHSAQEFDLAVG